MKKLAYVVLAHEHPDLVARHVTMLLDADPSGQVVVHYDGGVARADFEQLKIAIAKSPRAWLVADPVKCEWGNFTLVEAVVRAMRLIRDRELDCDYVYLLSCSCVPIKPIAKLKRFLSLHEGMEFIEAAPPSWVKDGLREERYSMYHWFSWRTQRWLFDACVEVQRKLKIKRRVPRGLAMRFGSQWWCLTRKTCDGIVGFIDERPRDFEFFRRSWIPDEMFFQTVATYLAGEELIAGKALTFFMFGAKGRPVSFYDDHRDTIEDLPFFFARKVSPSAKNLRKLMAGVAAGPDDGGPMPTLEPDAAIAKYHRDVARSVNFARPGQSFYAWQINSGWPSSFAAYRGVLCVLYGPPVLTRMVREHLRRSGNVTLLGRVFHPDRVDLCALGDEFAGFSADDNKIRDFDRPLYLSRLLVRCKRLPIIEMAPGDGEYAERHFHQDSKVFFISCVPADISDADMLRLYWLFVATGCEDLASLAPGEANPRENIEEVRSNVDAYLGRALNANHRKWVEEVICGPTRSDRLFPVLWNPKKGLRTAFEKGALEKAVREYGSLIPPVIEFLASIEAGNPGAAGPPARDGASETMLRKYARCFLGPDHKTGSAGASAAAPNTVTAIARIGQN